MPFERSIPTLGIAAAALLVLTGWWLGAGLLADSTSSKGPRDSVATACPNRVSHAMRPSTICIHGVPHIQQRPDFCGEACVAMVLRKLGYRATQEDVFGASGVDPSLGRGCLTRELMEAVETLGFRPGSVWTAIDPKHAKAEVSAAWNTTLRDLRRGTPSIVCMRYDDRPNTTEHFRLILGYDEKRDEVIYHEPAEANGAQQRMRRSTFLDLWPLRYNRDAWALVRMAMRAGKITLPKKSGPGGFTPADFAQHVRKLRPRVPEGFTLLIESPFVVLGDEEPAEVRLRATKTVRWFVQRIQKLYFAKPPPEIYDIWLFCDKASYRRHAKALFGEGPDTPFGYFSHTHGALVMNIATGGGTLCHEIVHAFVASNFPECPAWFNEGLASLYEQCTERDGRLVGLTNWRLAGLQEEIRNGTLPSFRALLSTTTDDFYAMRRGDNYAQARYLCYYLQEHDRLVTYYKAFVKNAEEDPSGYETLMRVLGRKGEADRARFEEEWQTWVLTLRFP